MEQSEAEQIDFVNDTLSSIGIELHRTCIACPEQYEVFQWEEYIGMIHVRHGVVSVFDKDDLAIHTEPVYGSGAFTSEERVMGLINSAIRIGVV